MTNAEVIAHDLRLIGKEENAMCVADYINCPSSPNCTYKGDDNSMCTECKIAWLQREFED